MNDVTKEEMQQALDAAIAAYDATHPRNDEELMQKIRNTVILHKFQYELETNQEHSDDEITKRFHALQIAKYAMGLLPNKDEFKDLIEKIEDMEVETAREFKNVKK